HLWEDLSDQIHRFLSEISLASLITRREISQISKRQDMVENRSIELT
ncbi:MAG: Fe-S cluster assembly transcriptional regulator IscR, partial [Pseudomonadales bacterium]